MTTATGDKQSYSYDTLKRLGMVTTANASGTTLFYTARSYAAGASSNQTTNRLSGFAYRKSGGGILNYNTYTYDAAGNITQINQVLDSGTRTLAKYSYDAQNQLTQEICYNYTGTSLTPSSTNTTNYSYDTAGNLIKSISNGGATWITYTYGDGDWADLLTAVEVNGKVQQIAYEGQKYSIKTKAYGGEILSGNEPAFCYEQAAIILLVDKTVINRLSAAA